MRLVGLGVILITLLIVFSTMPLAVHASDLPPDIVEKLHTDLKIISLKYDVFPFIKDYYKVKVIKVSDLYYEIKACDVLILCDVEGELKLTTEQINTIIEFVKGGGGLIIYYDVFLGHRPMSDSTLFLLSKLGIEIKAINYDIFDKYVIVKKDGFSMIDHPITTGVEAIKFHLDYPVTAVGIDQGTIVIKHPFVVVAKEFGKGRVIFLGNGGGDFEPELSGVRFAVNCIEWVAGYTPPGWNPPTINKYIITKTVTVTESKTVTVPKTVTTIVEKTITVPAEKTVTTTLRETKTLEIVQQLPLWGYAALAIAVVAIVIAITTALRTRK